MNKKSENHGTHSGYYIYSTMAIIGFILLIAFVCYLVYDLLIKLTSQEISNATLVQAVITLLITIFVGGIFGKNLELRNSRKLEFLKVQKDIALTVIELTKKISSGEDSKIALAQLYFEINKAELFFNKEVADSIKGLHSAVTQENYDKVIENMRKVLNG